MGGPGNCFLFYQMQVVQIGSINSFENSTLPDSVVLFYVFKNPHEGQEIFQLKRQKNEGLELTLSIKIYGNTHVIFPHNILV